MHEIKCGSVFGNITLLELMPDRDKFGHKQWKCLCKCGRECIVTSSHVRRGPSCGCRVGNNLVGKRFGRLVVVERLGVGKHRCRLYRCVCDCGEVRIITSHNLRGVGGTQSCGCLARERGCLPLSEGEAAFNHLYSTYRLSAKRRKISFDLSKEQFRIFTQHVCYYCGAVPYQVFGTNRHNGCYVYSDVDRLNPQQGYQQNNCVACCGICNKMKMTLAYDAFIGQITAIAKHHKLG